jgi:hypothetical protein
MPATDSELDAKHHELGGMETIATILRGFAANAGGAESFEKNVDDMVDDANALLTNSSLVGALLFSALYPALVTSSTVNPSASDFFGTKAANVIHEFYRACLTLVRLFHVHVSSLQIDPAARGP